MSKLNITNCCIIKRNKDPEMFVETSPGDFTVTMNDYYIVPADEYTVLTNQAYAMILEDLHKAEQALFEMHQNSGKKLRYPMKPRTN